MTIQVNRVIKAEHNGQLLAWCLHQADNTSLNHLSPEELKLYDSLHHRNKGGFAASRIALKQAVTALGLPEFSYLSYNKDKNNFPPDIIFSISHKQDFGAAYVTKRNLNRDSGIKSVGIDIEQLSIKTEMKNALTSQELGLIAERSQRLIKRICGNDEAKFYAQLTSQTVPREEEVYLLYELSVKLFSIKEAIYKSFYNQFTKSLSFSRIEVSFPDKFNQSNQMIFTAGITDYKKIRLSGNVLVESPLIISHVILE